MITIKKLNGYDFIGRPSYHNVELSPIMLDMKIIDFFSKDFAMKYNGRGIIKKFRTGCLPYNYTIIKNIIDYERKIKNDEGFKLNIGIVETHNLMKQQTAYDIANLYETCLTKEYLLKLNGCDINFFNYQQCYEPYKIISSYKLDLIILNSFEIQYEFYDRTYYRFQEKRRDGSPMVKLLFMINDTNLIETFINDGFYIQNVNNWTEEDYLVKLRDKKFNRLLNE